MIRSNQRSGRGGRRFKSCHSDQYSQWLSGDPAVEEKSDRLISRMISAESGPNSALLAGLNYDPETGILRWARPRRGVVVGSVAGSLDHHGYIVIRLDRRIRFAHRLAWELHYGREPVGDVDHMNGIRSDNRIANLREATRSQNLANQGAQKSGTSGFKGVSFNRRVGKWEAKICRQGARRTLGYFNDPADAARAVDAASVELDGEFARLNFPVGRSASVPPSPSLWRGGR